MDVSVVIPTYNRADALALTLDRLAEIVFEGSWEVIVVNNNSADSTDQVVENAARFFPVELTLLHESRSGAAAARNLGARKARGKYLLFIDNDILAAKDLIRKHFDRLSSNHGAWIAGSTVNAAEANETPFAKYRSSLGFEAIDSAVGAAGMAAANLSMPRDGFWRLNGFDEEFYVASGEDRDLALRAQAEGIKIIFDPTISAIHNDWAGSSIRDFCTRQRIYTQTEPYFWRKYGNETPRLDMVRRNLPPEYARDGLKLYLSKTAKSFVGSDLGQSLMFTLCDIVEKAVPSSKILKPLYRTAIAGAIYRGFQEGLRKMDTTSR